jgi:hypothetical protein
MRVRLLLLLAPFLTCGCAAEHNPVSTGSGSGFWMGLWHGLILPISFLISLFKNDVGIYQVANNGAWYDCGFLVGVLLLGILLFERHGGIVYIRADGGNDKYDSYTGEDSEEP